MGRQDATQKKRDGPTDGPRTDRPSYRDAWTHLKMKNDRNM